MEREEYLKYIDNAIKAVFEEERRNLPRSEFAGIRNPKAKVKRTNNLRNNSWKMKKINDLETNLELDLLIAPYAETINDRANYITYKYYDKIEEDVYKKLLRRLGGKSAKQ